MQGHYHTCVLSHSSDWHPVWCGYFITKDRAAGTAVDNAAGAVPDPAAAVGVAAPAAAPVAPQGEQHPVLAAALRLLVGCRDAEAAVAAPAEAAAAAAAAAAAPAAADTAATDAPAAAVGDGQSWPPYGAAGHCWVLLPWLRGLQHLPLPAAVYYDLLLVLLLLLAKHSWKEVPDPA